MPLGILLQRIFQQQPGTLIHQPRSHGRWNLDVWGLPVERTHISRGRGFTFLCLTWISNRARRPCPLGRIANVCKNGLQGFGVQSSSFTLSPEPSAVPPAAPGVDTQCAKSFKFMNKMWKKHAQELFLVWLVPNGSEGGGEGGGGKEAEDFCFCIVLFFCFCFCSLCLVFFFLTGFRGRGGGPLIGGPLRWSKPIDIDSAIKFAWDRDQKPHKILSIIRVRKVNWPCKHNNSNNK